MACLGVLAAVVSMLLPLRDAPLAGFVFFATGIYKTVHGPVTRPHIRRAQAQTPEHEMEPLPH